MNPAERVPASSIPAGTATQESAESDRSATVPGRCEGGPKRLLRELPQSGQERADSGQRLAVLVAHPLRLVAPRDEVDDSVPVEVQPGGAEDEGANRALGTRLPELVRKAGELAQLENVGARDRRYAEALGDRRPDGVRRGPDLLLPQIDAGEHDSRAVQVAGDVEATAEHAAQR
jgi:hypothetical protein